MALWASSSTTEQALFAGRATSGASDIRRHNVRALSYPAGDDPRGDARCYISLPSDRPRVAQRDSPAQSNPASDNPGPDEPPR
jgi:hypothetical protein